MDFRARATDFAERIAHDGMYQVRLQDKRRRRAHDERVKPLDAYRCELARRHETFFGSETAYDDARKCFVYKLAAGRQGERQASPRGGPDAVRLTAP